MKQQNHITRYLFLILLSNLLTFPLQSQEWTEPVQVSDTIGYHMAPDMCVDNNGTIHVVWSNQLSYPFWKIMYSKSEDNGETWSEDFDISKNDTLWMSQPHIANDSKNTLYVTYDYNTIQPSNMHVLMKIYDGQVWSDSILITDGMPGSDYNKLIVDNNDDVIIGWYRNSKYFYKFYSNGSLSNEYCPYCDSTDIFLPVEFSLSTNQIIKWIGSSASLNYYNSRLQYYEHYIFNNQWYLPELIDSSNIQVGKDIALNIFENPEVSYRIETSVWPNPFTDATMYIKYNGQNWSETELVVEDPEHQQIVIDQYDRTHVVNREKTPTGYQLVHYRKINNEWIGLLIDTGYIVQRPKLIFENDQLKIVYDKTWKVGNNEFIVDIMYSEFDIITNIEEQQSNINQVLIYPNPSKGNVNIEFEIHETNNLNIIISDFYGRHIKSIVNNKMVKGKHKIIWNGKNNQGVKVKSGLYFCRLYCGRNVITKSIEIIN